MFEASANENVLHGGLATAALTAADPSSNLPADLGG